MSLTDQYGEYGKTASGMTVKPDTGAIRSESEL
jgi:hypothetical protein